MDDLGFLRAIGEQPIDDGLRLIYADWLDDHGDPDQAEYVRLAWAFDPHRDRYDDPAINATRDRLHELNRDCEKAEEEWWESLDAAYKGWDHGLEWRRGFVDSLALPAEWFLRSSRVLRERYPTLRKLVVYRLNGWGERLAACPDLAGLREIELACWYSRSDAYSVAASPWLAAVERVTLWDGDNSADLVYEFASRPAWPKLRELRLVANDGPKPTSTWVEAVNEVAGRSIASVYDFCAQLYPFAPDFADYYGFHIGKRPDGTQLFAYGDESGPDAVGWIFNADGSKREPFRFEFPSSLWYTQEAGWPGRSAVLDRRKTYLTEQTGFAPAFIRVEGFTLEALDLAGTGRFRGDVAERWGVEDDPNVPPEGDDFYLGGNGQVCRDAVERGEFTFDFGNEWWCDRTGQITST